MITPEDFNGIVRDLEDHHGIFSRIWQMGRPISDEKIPTACVLFDKTGGYFGFHFNPKFWDSLDDYNRKFVICHEALHVILSHGPRMRTKIPQIANMAADVVINESLVKNFGFTRSRIQNQADFCWLDTVFKDQPVLPEKSLEYYYEELMKNTKVISISMPSQGGGKPSDEKDEKGDKQGPRTVDEHKGFGEDAQDQVDDKVSEAADSLSDEEIEALKNKIEQSLDEETKTGLQAGTTAGGLTRIIAKQKIVKKRKWETVIRKWSEKYLRPSDKSQEQWARINRRFATMASNDLFIPTEMEIDAYNEEKHRIKVMFFLDTSGSCSHLADRFWKAAESLPTDRFDIQLCCFDTEVYETTFESRKLYGFGGTSFSVIEAYIKKKTEKTKYPEAVFIITDGYGDSVKPIKPKNWYWFLSVDYKSCIPKESKVFMLKDYE